MFLAEIDEFFENKFLCKKYKPKILEKMEKAASWFAVTAKIISQSSVAGSFVFSSSVLCELLISVLEKGENRNENIWHSRIICNW